MSILKMEEFTDKLFEKAEKITILIMIAVPIGVVVILIWLATKFYG